MACNEVTWRNKHEVKILQTHISRNYSSEGTSAGGREFRQETIFPPEWRFAMRLQVCTFMVTGSKNRSQRPRNDLFYFIYLLFIIYKGSPSNLRNNNKLCVHSTITTNKADRLHFCKMLKCNISTPHMFTVLIKWRQEGTMVAEQQPCRNQDSVLTHFLLLFHNIVSH